MSEGNINTDEASDSELVEEIMRRQMKVREEFRRADSLDRLKKLMKERLYEYKDMSYEQTECSFKIVSLVGGMDQLQ